MSMREILRKWREQGRFGTALRALESLREGMLTPIQRPLLPLIVRRIKSMGQIEDIDELISIASRRFLRAIVPIQRPSEIRALLRAVQELKPRRLLEIGTANGGTLFLLTRVSPPDAQIISIDLPGGPFGGDRNEWKHPLWMAFATGKQMITLLRANSHDAETLEAVNRELAGWPLDFLMIDGDHSYAGVRLDFEMYSSLVRPGGLIVFHDICRHPEGAGGDVFRFWSEIRHGRDATEFVEDPGGGFGIGVLRV